MRRLSTNMKLAIAFYLCGIGDVFIMAYLFNLTVGHWYAFPTVFACVTTFIVNVALIIRYGSNTWEELR